MDYVRQSPSTALSQSYHHHGSLESVHMASPPTGALGHQLSGAHTSQHLPGYLMGDMSTPASTRLWSSRSSPPMNTTSGSRESAAMSRSESRMSHRVSSTRTPKDKCGAPPVAALFDNVVASPAGVFTGTPEMRQYDLAKIPLPNSSYNAGTPRTSALYASPSRLPGHQQSFLPSQQHVCASPAQIDPFYTQGESITPDVQLDETWVTVFGFPPVATSFILQQFSQYGSIIRHVVASNGNWLHLRYNSKLQAKKALSKNGKVYGSNMMIGVMHCIDKGVMSGGELSNLSTLTTETPVRHLIAQDEPEVRTSVRPLTAAYKVASSSHEVIESATTPQKSSNLVSKTLEYMFGW